MSALVTLTSPKGDRLTIDQQGAYITSLRSADGQDILFARTHIGEKLRGGLPVCAPVFGPGDAVGLKQHGFARDVEWTVHQRSADALVLTFDAVGHEAIPSVYQGCTMLFTVKISENSLFVGLSIENRGDMAFVCSPGLHPYFPTADATTVTIQSDSTRHFTADELAATQFLPPHQAQVEVQLAGCKVFMTSTTLQQYAVWSANPDTYICVEPTWAGNLDAQATMQLLLPGEKMHADMTLKWSFA